MGLFVGILRPHSEVLGILMMNLVAETRHRVMPDDILVLLLPTIIHRHNTKRINLWSISSLLRLLSIRYTQQGKCLLQRISWSTCRLLVNVKWIHFYYWGFFFKLLKSVSELHTGQEGASWGLLFGHLVYFLVRSCILTGDEGDIGLGKDLGGGAGVLFGEHFAVHFMRLDFLRLWSSIRFLLLLVVGLSSVRVSAPSHPRTSQQAVSVLTLFQQSQLRIPLLLQPVRRGHEERLLLLLLSRGFFGPTQPLVRIIVSFHVSRRRPISCFLEIVICWHPEGSSRHHLLSFGSVFLRCDVHFAPETRPHHITDFGKVSFFTFILFFLFLMTIGWKVIVHLCIRAILILFCDCERVEKRVVLWIMALVYGFFVLLFYHLVSCF